MIELKIEKGKNGDFDMGNISLERTSFLFDHEFEGTKRVVN